MTGASQLLYSGAYSGSKPCFFYQLQMLIMCFTFFSCVKIMKCYWYLSFCMTESGEVDHFVDFCFLILFYLISSSSTNTPPNWTIHSSDIQTWVSLCHSYFNLLFAFGKSNIRHIWMLPWEHLLWLWFRVRICLSPVRSCTYWFCFVSFCVSHPPLFSPVLPLLSPHHARHAPAAPTLRTLQLAARSLPAQGQPQIPTLNPR